MVLFCAFLAISSYQEVDLFSEIRGPDFNTVFGSNQPATSGAAAATSGTAGVGVSLNQYTMGDILTPQAVGPHAQQQPTSTAPKGLTSDVDSSLAAAAANLSMFATTTTTTTTTTATIGGNQFATRTTSTTQLWAGKPV